MASTTALFTGLSGLISNSRRLDVIGNNISNVNTTAFKSNRIQFTPTFSRNFSLGSAPSGSTGGTNPGQIGLGVTIAGYRAGELLAEDLRHAQNSLSEITGEFTPDDLLGRIFSSFCIGK